MGARSRVSSTGSDAACALDVAYWQRQVDEYADPNVFFGTTIVFPNAVASGRANGLDARLEFAPGAAWSGYANLGIAKVTQTGPITGGLFLEDDVADIGPGVEFTPDHDQRVVALGRPDLDRLARQPVGRRADTRAARRSNSTRTKPTSSRRAPAPTASTSSAGASSRARRVSLLGTLRVWQDARAAVSLRGAVLNLFDARYAYNFGNPFSGTHFGAPRTASVTVRIETR